MAIGREEVAGIVTRIGDRTPALRDNGAEQAADLVPDMSTTEAETVAATLVRAAVAETDATALESQLNALAMIAFTHGVNEDVLAPVLRLTGLAGSAAEHVSDLRRLTDGDWDTNPTGHSGAVAVSTVEPVVLGESRPGGSRWARVLRVSRRSWAGDEFVLVSNTGKNSGLLLPLPEVGRFTGLLRTALDTSGPVGELEYRVGRRARRTWRVRVQGGDPIRLRCHSRGFAGIEWFTIKVPAQCATDLLPVFEDEAARIAELG